VGKSERYKERVKERKRELKKLFVICKKNLFSIHTIRKNFIQLIRIGYEK